MFWLIIKDQRYQQAETLFSPNKKESESIVTTLTIKRITDSDISFNGASSDFSSFDTTLHYHYCFSDSVTVTEPTN